MYAAHYTIEPPVLHHHLSPSIYFTYTSCTTVNQQILAAIKFGVSQNKAIYVNLAARLCSVRSTYMLAATNIGENTQFDVFAKYNSTPKFVDLQYLSLGHTLAYTAGPGVHALCTQSMQTLLMHTSVTRCKYVSMETATGKKGTAQKATLHQVTTILSASLALR